MEQVDAVVVGSGFGGSVSAYRLAEAGRSVVLLERGRPYPPGSFPRSPAEMGRAFWDPAAGLYGMYDVWRFDGCDSVVSAGLGGGSLIYANVLLRKDERWFVHEEMPDGTYESWPLGRADLDPHYDAVEKMMDPRPFPLGRPPFDNTPKAHAMQDAAAELGLDVTLPPLAVRFSAEPGGQPAVGLPIAEPSYGNIHGVPRRTCNLCGECDIGCNDGSKNTLDHTYLSAAKHHGADIRIGHEVKAVRPRPGGGYEVDYVVHDMETKSRKPPVRTIGCDRLILSAGTYGTSHILLKSRAALPNLSGALGTRFSGNGDLLTFLLKAKDRNRVRPLDAARGPVITSAIRLPDEVDGVPGAGRGAYIQDGGYPGFVDWAIQGLDVPGSIERMVKFLAERFLDFFKDVPDTHLSAELSELVGSGSLTVSSLPLLGMGRDVPDGRLDLDRHGRLYADWTTKTSEAYFERVRKTMQSIADVLGAEYADNPMWFRKRIITVHPLGGAPMGRHSDVGVCDSYGEVYGHPGLYVADGSVMPGPVGPNPSLTIAAFADRMSTRLLETSAPVSASAAVSVSASGAATIGVASVGVSTVTESGAAESGATASGAVESGVRVAGAAVFGVAVTGAAVAASGGASMSSGAGPATSAGPQQGAGSGSAYAREAGTPAGHGDRSRHGGGRTSLSFTEQMKGHITFGTPDPRSGEVDENREPFAFRLTITAEDVHRFLAEPEHEAGAEGWIEAAGCGGRRPVRQGWFNLFAPTGEEQRRVMRYRLFFTDDGGRDLTLTGEKNVLHGPPTRIWPDTSTLYTRLLAGHVRPEDDPDAEVVGAGVLHIQLTDFARQLTTFRTGGPRGTTALVEFGRFFAGELWEVYGPDLT
ncbi:GMC oxidoreductase [Actinomadura rupiterrae]|uniref:GMC oxidoreductase n=1 Tax=Actinomadura rupiterrae TaxID=559627 RepID=UPI0020A2BA45|nr:GMC family oxidoreductase [Actinomadura rupiterrae]MCP2339477.1 cholesterol oxidase [Actinomadura rupiterrae]